MLFAPSQLEYQSNSGVRLTLGRWLDPGQTLGIELAGFCLETHTIHGKADSSDQGVPLIARPFFNTQTGREEALVITAPGELIGGIDVFADSRLWGGEFNFLGAWRRDPGFRLDWLAGFRYLGLKDELRFSQGSQQMHWSEIHFLGVPVGEPAILSIKDLFETLNHFYGGQVGLRGELELGRITLGGSAKAGIGVTHQELSITGDTVLTDSGGNNQVALGGLYALPTNIGKSTHDRFAFVSEVNVQTGWRIGPRLSTFLGYSFLYWSAVARPGAEINRNIDPQQVPSSPTFDPLAATTQPARIFQSTAFWAQGINAGLEFRW